MKLSREKQNLIEITVIQSSKREIKWMGFLQNAKFNGHKNLGVYSYPGFS
jgi:hypothetical protein